MKDFKESVYHSAIISVLTVGYTMLGKTLVKMSPPSLGKFDIEDGVKLVTIVAMSDSTKDYQVISGLGNPHKLCRPSSLVLLSM